MQSSPDLQGFALPVQVNPPDSICIQIPVPNDPAHIAAFIGVLYDLTLWNSWQRDPLHRGVKSAQVWKKIWNDIVNQSEFGNCPENPVAIAESDYDMTICEQLRFNPATGQFEGLCCGEWTPISGQPASGLLLGQPASGSDVPQPGACQTYQGTLNASGQWLCPAIVNAGDTIQITKLNGAWTDNSGNWYCPQGFVFFGGLCTVDSGVNGADPAPASPHMGLLSKISGAYQFIGDGAVSTVPGGVVNKLLILQANDASLADNSGQITFEVKVCNNQSAVWTRYLDFTSSNRGFVPNSLAGYTPDQIGTWSPGVGWIDSVAHQSTPEYTRGIIVTLSGITPFNCTRVELFFDMTKGAFVSGSEYGILVSITAGASTVSGINLLNPATTSGSGQDISAAAVQTGTDSIKIIVICSTSTPTDTTAGSVLIRGLRVFGTGPIPPQLGSTP